MSSDKILEIIFSGRNRLRDGLKCFADNCEKMNMQAALLGADHFQLDGKLYKIADGLQDNQIAALSNFDSYLHGKMSFEHFIPVMVMNRKMPN